MSVVPSGYFTVTVPSFPTVISVFSGSFGSKFLFASSIAFLTASFSSFVRFVGSVTETFVDGATGLYFSLSACTTISEPSIVSTELSLYVTVTFPSSPTEIVIPPGESGFALITASLTAAFSSVVKSLGFFTITFLFGKIKLYSDATDFFTIFDPWIVSVVPSGYFTVTVPSFPTSNVVFSGSFGFKSLFASSIAFLTASFSVSVKFAGSATGTFVVGDFGSNCSDIFIVGGALNWICTTLYTDCPQGFVVFTLTS